MDHGQGCPAGIGRPEFEYEIPVADAEEMIRTLCDGPPVEKTRHTVHHSGLVWSIDIHLGALAGIEFAEVELRHPDERIELPGWVGEEVTHDIRFRKETLLRRYLETADTRVS
jgi:CYTH domain-containing protein